MNVGCLLRESFVNAGYVAGGSAKVKVAPRPGPGLSARIEPPCPSTRWRAIVSPIPLPPLLRARDRSAR